MTSTVVPAFDDSRWEVPSFTTLEIAPRRTRYCICVFVLNEGERIRNQLKKMQATAPAADIVIADGGSKDGALEPGFLAGVGVRTLLTKTGPGALGAQMRMAFAYALREGYAGVITIDGNDKDDTSAIQAFVAALDDGAGHVQGSRFRRGGRALNTPPARYWGIRLVHAPLIALAAGFPYTDTTNGFRAYSRALLLDPRVNPFRHIFAAYELHYYMAIRAAVLGYRIREIPVTRAYPAHGPIPTKIHSWRGNLKVLAALGRACLHLYDPRS